MNQFLEIVIYSLLAGLTIFLGGLLACITEKHFKKNVESHIMHWSIAFGGGILIAAVAFVLTPKGMELFSIEHLSIIFLAGAVTFFFFDKFIERKGGLFAQSMAMLMDFIPEALALGAVFAQDHHMGILLAFFIGFQNFPESFNAYFDLRKNNQSPKNILIAFFLLSFLGVLLSLAGNGFLIQLPRLTAGIMIFSAGGILYLIFQDIAPSSKMRNNWDPALGANLGFLVGMIGAKIFV
jgi:ZIP family zinc transporter